MTVRALLRFASLALALGCAPAAARADLHDVEISLGAGALDRATAGVGDEDRLAHETGLAVDLSLRFFVGERDGRSPADGGQCIHPGLSLRGVHMAGSALGIAGHTAYRVTIADLAFALRSACIALGRWLLSGYGGASLAFGAPADGLYGTAASFSALGGNVGADLSGHFGPLLVGPFIDVRFMAAFGDGPESRLSTAEVGLRIGWEIDLAPRDEEEGDPRRRFF